jgi:hypothetical protein
MVMTRDRRLGEKEKGWRRWARRAALLAGVVSLGGPFLLQAQSPAKDAALLDESGQTLIHGTSAPYRIRRLPVSSFPELPAAFREQLERRGCLIPQTYEAHRPENVIHGSLERSGSSDWAVLCSAQGTVSLLAFFSSAPFQVQTLATATELQRLQEHDPSGVLGFNWGIDPVSPDRVHEAQSGLVPRPARLDHDALADSIVEHRTVYHFYVHNAWVVLDMPR